MTREILFKAKRLDNGEWIEGFYFSCWNKHYILWGMTNNIPNMIEIDKKTLRQLTGLLDKNGNKIFEGDKLIHHETKEVLFIAFRKCCFYLIGEDDLIIEPLQYHAEWLETEDKKIEIIGNIHDKE